ncbi:hypothetical protein BBP40_011988 [Aspergillus hancockii]|nr:hypothetical protein BBP40_011988 [Aspergillus hancockii]
MSTPTYDPKEPLVIDLRDYIFRFSERTPNFRKAIHSAHDYNNGGWADMEIEHIHTLDDYIRYCDEMLRWTPKVSTKGDELPRKLLIFHWTPIRLESANKDLTWLSYWLVAFTRETGQFMNTPEPAGSIYTFYLNEDYKKE